MHLLRRRRVPADERSFQRPPGGGELLLHPLAQMLPSFDDLQISKGPRSQRRSQPGHGPARSWRSAHRKPLLRSQPVLPRPTRPICARLAAGQKCARTRGASVCQSPSPGAPKGNNNVASTVRAFDGDACEVRLLCECGILPIRISIHLFRSF